MYVKISSLVIKNIDPSSFYSVILNKDEKTPPGMYIYSII